MSKTMDKSYREVRKWAVWLFLETEARPPSRRQAVISIAAKIGSQAKAVIGRWIASSNPKRPQAAHGGQGT